MLQDTTPAAAQATPDASPVDAGESVRELIERLQAEIKFSKTRIEALNVEVARLKRWRFGSSSESLEMSTQAVLFEAHRDTGSEIAGQAVALIARLYEIEREARDLAPEARHLLRLERSRPITQALHTWLVAKRQTLARADATAPGHRLLVEQLAGVDPLPGRRQCAHRQQRG